MLQEHWLTPGNLHNFDTCFPDYFLFGRSAMTDCVNAVVLRGRQVITSIKNSLRSAQIN